MGIMLCRRVSNKIGSSKMSKLGFELKYSKTQLILAIFLGLSYFLWRENGSSKREKRVTIDFEEREWCSYWPTVVMAEPID